MLCMINDLMWSIADTQRGDSLVLVYQEGSVTMSEPLSSATFSTKVCPDIYLDVATKSGPSPWVGQAAARKRKKGFSVMLT